MTEGGSDAVLQAIAWTLRSPFVYQFNLGLVLGVVLHGAIRIFAGLSWALEHS